MLFISIFIVLMVGFVWGWYRHNYGKPGFDDWDTYDGGSDWHIKD
jgi:hypothetical protein